MVKGNRNGEMTSLAHCLVSESFPFTSVHSYKIHKKKKVFSAEQIFRVFYGSIRQWLVDTPNES